MAAYGKCVCGKSVSEKKDGTPRAHICNADGGPMWANLDHVQPIATSDVDEANAFLSGGPEPKPVKGPWFDATYDSTLDCGHWVNQGDEIRADGEGGWECREWCEDADTPSELDYTDGSAPSENWNGTGRPRPSASNVKLPEPEPQEDKPRLLDALRNANPGQMTVQQRAAAGLLGLAGQVVSAAQEAVQANGDALRDAFVSPTPQGSGPRRGSVAEAIEESHPGTARYVETYGLTGAPATHTGVPSMHSAVVATAATASRPDTADPFSSPTHVAPPLGSATDQPETERDRYGRYVIKDPRTGDFKRNRRGTPQGFTRATTYGKTLLDQFGIHQWEMRSVLAGLALRPDLVRAAQGLDVAADKDKLNEIAASAKDAAGGNEAASDGTEFHTVTEWIDTGRMEPKDAPEKFRAEALAYAAKMEEAGLTTRTEWIERVTFTDRGGEDVAGTADRILRDRSGQCVVGDVKSGKGVDLAQREIAIQLKVYAMGINQFGLYNKATQQWEPWTGPPVSEEYGIVMHVPVVRPEGTEAYCDLYRIDLRGVAPYEVSSAMHAAAWVREWRKQKGFLSPYHAPAPRQRTWAEAFSSVTTSEEANRLWEAAVEAGMSDVDLASNVALARRALQSHG